MVMDIVRVSPSWLDLREPADAASRAPELVTRVRRRLPPGDPVVIHDLGTGTGSMARWLAPQLPGPQRWVLYDRDRDLLNRASARMVGTAAGGAPLTVETRLRDITSLTAADLDGAALLTASALLDMLTAEEIERVVAACAGAGCPALIAISVTGRVEITPEDPLDQEIVEAFNAHQRRATNGRHLLGPDAAGACAAAFAGHGWPVVARSTPWRLGPDQAALAVEWLTGWLDAACEQRPELTAAVAGYAGRRLLDARAGRLHVLVHHVDLLAGVE